MNIAIRQLEEKTRGFYVRLNRLWDEAKHPRNPQGAEGGGRFIPIGGVPALTLVSELNRKHGFSYGIVNKKSPANGLMLSIHPERSASFVRGRLNAAVVKAYATKNHDLLAKPGNYLGGWYNSKTGKTFLDISTRVTDHAEARKLSMVHKQRAYWSIHEKKEYRVTEESRAHAVAEDQQQPNFVVVDASEFTDADAEAFVKALLGDQPVEKSVSKGDN